MPAALYQHALALVSTGQCSAATIQLNLAIIRRHSPSRALLAHMLIAGREGVAKDRNRAVELAKEGAHLGCHHCQGVLAECYFGGYGIPIVTALSLEFARESAGKSSRYGQYVLGWWYWSGIGGVAQNRAQALVFYRLAAAQNLDEAQSYLGFLHYHGFGVAQDYAEALRLYQLAAAQGLPTAMSNVGRFHEFGRGVRKNKAEAIRWYRRAQAAGHPEAADALERLCA
jgi:hypothetical protein